MGHHDMRNLFDLLDADSHGELTLEELLVGAPRIKGNASSIDVACIMLQLNRLEDMISRGVLQIGHREGSTNGSSIHGHQKSHSGGRYHHEKHDRMGALAPTSTTHSAN